ncbi:MAG TPA: TIGR03619 family F420-dependent LLM class oxidoreductase [Pseudonocardiaceae bacterium]|nr:TIGR03619 family F420-dependent LLM class oxidoreductase [Pseudonocardiaceae bacterium]
MRFGVHLGNFGPAASTHGIVGLAGAADRLGYASVWASDHIVTPQHFDSVYPYPGTVFTPDTAETVFEPIATLAYLAGSTEHVTVGTSVFIAPQRQPLVAAKQFATLDALCGGRVEVGLGAGWMREEFDILGADHRHRGAILDEHIELFQRVWTNTRTEYHGTYVEVPEVRFGPPPVRPGGPPLSIGGNGAVSVDRAARYGVGWHSFRLTPEEIAAGRDRYLAAAQRHGRTPGEVRILMRCNVSYGTADPDRPAWFLSGDTESIGAQVDAYRAAGVTDLIVSPEPGRPVEEGVRTLERLADEIVAERVR